MEEIANNVTDFMNCSCLALEEELIPMHDPMFFVYLAASFALTLFGGFMSGLTVTTMSFEETSLNIMLKTGSDLEKQRAQKVAPLLKRRHLLLVTLLLANAAAMEALPLTLDRIFPRVASLIISVTFVLFFGEIIPQAIFLRFRLAVAAGLHWLMWGLIGLLFIVAWPIGWLLDRLLGHDRGTIFTRPGLRELADVHNRDKYHDATLPLSDQEARLIEGVIDLPDKEANQVCTLLDDMFMLPISGRVDQDTIAAILASGFSRIPVYGDSRHDVRGVVLVKTILGVADSRPLNSLRLRQIPTVPYDAKLTDLFHLFVSGKTHMVAVKAEDDPVTGPGSELLGFVTLEDVLEEMLQEEIEDETELSPWEQKQGMRVLAALRANVARVRALRTKDLVRAATPTSESEEVALTPLRDRSISHLRAAQHRESIDRSRRAKEILEATPDQRLRTVSSGGENYAPLTEEIIHGASGKKITSPKRWD